MIDLDINWAEAIGDSFKRGTRLIGDCMGMICCLFLICVLATGMFLLGRMMYRSRMGRIETKAMHAQVDALYEPKRAEIEAKRAEKVKSQGIVAEVEVDLTDLDLPTIKNMNVEIPINLGECIRRLERSMAEAGAVLTVLREMNKEKE